MIVFQLSCSIFMSLVARFRAGLKAEIGVFFPMIVLRVLENVAQPNFQQKMIVLRFLEKLCDDSQILVDIFINYDCDVNSSNIFERMVNGLLKTAQGVHPGATTTLLPPQEATLKLEAMKSLVSILRSMGDWMIRQLRIPDPQSAKKYEPSENSSEVDTSHLVNGNVDEPTEASDGPSDGSNDVSGVQIIEQRRAYKLELQSSDDSATVTTNIIRLHETEYLASLEARSRRRMGRKAGGMFINKKTFGALHKPCMKEIIQFLNCLALCQNNDEKFLRQKELLGTCMEAQGSKKKKPWGSINYHLQRLKKGRK